MFFLILIVLLIKMELKNLLENASLSFSFAKELFKHNLVRFFVVVVFFNLSVDTNKKLKLKIQYFLGCIPEWRGSSSNVAALGRRHTRGQAQSSYLLFKAGQHKRGL